MEAKWACTVEQTTTTGLFSVSKYEQQDRIVLDPEQHWYLFHSWYLYLHPLATVTIILQLIYAIIQSAMQYIRMGKKHDLSVSISDPEILTLMLVAQHLNHCAITAPKKKKTFSACLFCRQKCLVDATGQRSITSSSQRQFNHSTESFTLQWAEMHVKYWDRRQASQLPFMDNNDQSQTPSLAPPPHQTPVLTRKSVDVYDSDSWLCCK